MSYEPSSYVISDRPDKPLVVKCDYNARRQKLSFTSARYCSYERLKEKIERNFSLSAHQFTIEWKDQDGEQNYIQDEESLDEAIEYYHSGDEGSVRSSGSGFASRSSSRHHKITVFVQIRVEYDGPSLSDTSSLASREDSPEGSQISFSPGELSTPQLDDDAVTVSSKDTRHRQGGRDPSLFKKLLTGGTRCQAAGSSTQNTLPRKSSRSRIFGFGSRASYTDDDAAGGSIRDIRSAGRGSNNPAGTEEAHTNDPSAVFERLKLQEQLSGSLPHEHSSLQTDRGQAWLQEQSNQTKASLGVVPVPSTSDDAISLDLSAPLSDGVPDILLEKDERGKYYYNYTGSGSSETTEDNTEYEAPVVETQPSKPPPHVETVQPFSVRSCAHADNDSGIPHELLIPEDVTNCDECGCILDQIRYICTTCGEKTPTSRVALEAAAAVKGKGKSRASPNCEYHHQGPSSEYDYQEEPAYPPRAHRGPFMLHFSPSVNTPAYPCNSKPLPALPPSSPPHPTLVRSIGSQSTLVPSSSSGSSSSTARARGYELCNTCFTKVGVVHSLVGGVDAPSPTLPPTSSELREPKQKGQLRHAFVEQVWGFYGWQVIEQAEMSPRCSGCQSVLSGNRYKCGTCNNYTICRACFSDVHNIHPIHPFLEMKVKLASRTRRSELSDDTSSEDDNVDEPSLKHPGVRCFNCEQDIVGARFHCVDCTMENIDICSNCETAGLPGNLDASDGGHSSAHIMLKIPMPLNMNQVQDVSQRAHGLRHGRDRADLRGLSPLMRSSPGSISSHTVSYDNGTGTDIEEDYVHLQICNSCNEPIIGVRYQCLNCPSKPSSFNLCSDCEAKSYRVHDAMHTFLKIRRPVDIPGPLESEFPIIPILYRDPAGPPPGSPTAERLGDPAAYLRDLTHAFALCDRHMQRIVGKWYRCAFCAKDLCTDCEVLDTHDNAHLFLVFKAPVDMQAFRHFADLDNPRGSPPVLRGSVYYPGQV